MQPDLFSDAVSRPRKRGHVPRTSVLAYRERPRDARASAVTGALSEYAVPVTSAELALDLCAEDGVRYDLSRLLATRRGLSDALALGLVEHAGERTCAVSGRKCVVWRTVAR